MAEQDEAVRLRGVLANLREVAINGGAMKRDGYYDREIIQAALATPPERSGDYEPCALCGCSTDHYKATPPPVPASVDEVFRSLQEDSDIADLPPPVPAAPHTPQMTIDGPHCQQCMDEMAVPAAPRYEQINGVTYQRLPNGKLVIDKPHGAVPAAPPLTDNQREAIAQQALIGPPVPAAPPLDVERLDAAWEQHYLHNDSVHECSGNCSADLAAEYARLSPKQEDSDGR